MLSRSWSLLILGALLCVALASPPADGQWKNVAPGLVAGTEFGGAMQFRDGIVWAAGDNVWRSIDSGKSWQRSGNFVNANINDIAFFDKRNGLIATEVQGVFHTSDGGNSWQHVIASGAIAKVSFNGSASVMHALDFSGIFYTSLDGGTTWNSSNISNGTCRSFAVANNGTIYAQSAVFDSKPYTGFVYRSTNLGQSWSQASGTMDGDCYTVAADSCDPTRLYIINEEVYQPTNDTAEIYLSTDGGTSWSVTFTHPSLFLSGSLATTNEALFAGTLDPTLGTYRSLDAGETWKSIGGPSVAPDSRSIAAINTNSVLAMDKNGSIWITTNGGGDSTESQLPYLGTVALSADTLFANDTIRCDSLNLPIYISWTGCRPPLPVQYRITGRDSDSFHITGSTSDSIVVEWTSQKPGSQQAWFIAELANGVRDSVALAGFSTTIPLVFSVAPQRLFSQDSDYISCTSSIDTIRISAQACLWPRVKSEEIVGMDSMDYIISHPLAKFDSSNSIAILFTPGDTGLRTATYKLTLDDGTVISIPLAGVGIATRDLSLATASLSEKTDTIGGEVVVPITVGGLARAETIELVLHYPLDDIEYDSSVNVAGARVDIPGEQWPGRSKLRIVGATSGAIAAYARFKVFSDTSYDPQVIFDSMNIPTSLTPCEYLPPPAATATIYPLQGCGIQMLSRWVHLGQRPLFSIRPNPTSGAISITSSIDVGDVSIEVYDMLGSVCARSTVSIGKNMPATLSLPLKSGIYYLRMISQSAEANYPIVIER